MSNADDDEKDEAAMLLKALLTTRPRLHLFAPCRRGFTALAVATNKKDTYGCLSVLLEATQRAVSEAVVSIVCCRRERHQYEPAARELKDVLENAFPGVQVRTLDER